MASRSRTRGRVSHDRWLVSYADFITLLFAFFATMYAISSVDAQKLVTVVHGLQQAFDEPAPVRKTSAAEAPATEAVASALEKREMSMGELQTAVMRDLQSEIATNMVNLIVDRRGITLSIPETGSFSTGQDELSVRARGLLVGIAETVQAFSNPIRVEGHTDDVPIHTVRFRSNWDLSAARASRVVEYLIERGGLDPERLSATGFAEFHPRVPNDSQASRASNRRIDVVILDPSINPDTPAIAGPNQ